LLKIAWRSFHPAKLAASSLVKLRFQARPRFLSF